MANHVVGTSKRMVVSTGHGATKDMGAAASTARQYSHLSPSMGGSDTSRQGETAGMGTKKATSTQSSHNDIGKFTSGISEHHPYKPRGGAFDTRKNSVVSDTGSMSDFKTPNGGTGRVASKKVSEVRKPDRYNDPKVENAQSAKTTTKNPSGPKGGIRAVMNKMAKS